MRAAAPRPAPPRPDPLLLAGPALLARPSSQHGTARLVCFFFPEAPKRQHEHSSDLLRARFLAHRLPPPAFFLPAASGKTVVGYAVDLKKDFECKFSQSSGQCSCKLVPHARDCKSITHWDGVTSRYGGTCDPAHSGKYSDMN